MLISGCLVFLLASVTYAALPLPSYMKPCARTDPKFNDCALQRANEVIPHIIHGDRKYKIPDLDPLLISEIKIGQGPRQSGFSLTVNDAKAYYINEAKVDSVKFDFDKKKIHIEITFPRLNVLGKYQIAGNILVLPINGKGDFNMTLVGSKCTFDTDYTLQETKGEQHIKIQNSRSTMVPTRAHTRFTNLFNGNKFLSDELHAFIEENWRDVYKETSPIIIETVTEIITSIINGISESMTYDTIFPTSV